MSIAGLLSWLRGTSVSGAGFKGVDFTVDMDHVTIHLMQLITIQTIITTTIINDCKRLVNHPKHIENFS